LKTRFDTLDISRAALEQAAEFWASLRKAGVPTAGPQVLDADSIFAGMAATAFDPSDIVMIATTKCGPPRPIPRHRRAGVVHDPPIARSASDEPTAPPATQFRHRGSGILTN
jgi:hypothetical protein